jgi:hypothetical protein
MMSSGTTAGGGPHALCAVDPSRRAGTQYIATFAATLRGPTNLCVDGGSSRTLNRAARRLCCPPLGNAFTSVGGSPFERCRQAFYAATERVSGLTGSIAAVGAAAHRAHGPHHVPRSDRIDSIFTAN